MALTSWSYQPLLYSPPLQGSFSNGSQAGICCQILFKMDVPAQNTKRHVPAVFITSGFWIGTNQLLMLAVLEWGPVCRSEGHFHIFAEQNLIDRLDSCPIFRILTYSNSSFEVFGYGPSVAR
jgi:hypothetical protein